MASTAATSAAPRAKRPVREVPSRPEPVPFGPGSALWEDMGNVLFIAASGGAFMLQGMHPQISGAVDEHSVFRTDPLGRATRSVDSMMHWVYGGEAAIKEGERLRKLHQPVHGTDKQGRHYAALDSEAWSWVWATSYVTEITTFPLLRGRQATETEKRELYEESKQLARIIRVPEKSIPETVQDYWDYYEKVVTEDLELTVVAAEQLERQRNPGIRIVPGPFDLVGKGLNDSIGWLTSALTLGGMREDARQVLGVTWTARDQRRLELLMAVARPTFARLPERFRYMPLAYHARRFHRELRRADRRQTKSLDIHHSAPVT
ncbi:MAG: DUF2236 domain-containing protein [Solirubrobacteraceae bacterium]|nr:DUF2236 domain-containing protein [Solirubrobacteraceae bacterium]